MPEHSFADDFKRMVSSLAVLTLLHRKNMYGYEINQQLNERGKGKLNISVLYTVLYQLERQGYISICDKVVEKGRARSYYAITPAGRAYFSQTVAEYRQMLGMFLSMLEEKP